MPEMIVRLMHRCRDCGRHHTIVRGHAQTCLCGGAFAPDARFIGTDATEHWTLTEFRAFAEPVFARGRGWSYPATDRTITIAPIECLCIAWFEEKLVNTSYGVTRGSGVLRLTESGWKIEQYVLSFAVPNDRSDAVVAAIKAEPAP